MFINEYKRYLKSKVTILLFVRPILIYAIPLFWGSTIGNLSFAFGNISEKG